MNKTLSLFLGCFIAPIIAAIVVLKFDLITPAQSNFGTFVEKNIQLAQWPNQQKKWSILMVEPKLCDKNCIDRKEMVNNIYEVLGKHNLSVGSYSLIAKSSEQAALVNLNTERAFEIPFLTMSESLNNDALYLVDHRGLVVLRYAVNYRDEMDRVMKKGLIKDLKKLLNYSRSRA